MSAPPVHIWAGRCGMWPARGMSRQTGPTNFVGSCSGKPREPESQQKRAMVITKLTRQDPKFKLENQRRSWNSELSECARLVVELVLKIICKVRGPVEIFTIPKTNNIFTYCCARSVSPGDHVRAPSSDVSCPARAHAFGVFYACLGLFMIYHRQRQSYFFKIKTSSDAFNWHTHKPTATATPTPNPTSVRVDEFAGGSFICLMWQL